MTVSDGDVRSHRTAPVHAVTTHPTPTAAQQPAGQNPATPTNVQLDLKPDERPDALRTRSLSGDPRPGSRMMSVPGLTVSPKQEK